MAKLVSKTYGDALFDLAVEKNTVDELMSQTKVVTDALDGNPEMIRLLNSPKITTEDKQEVLEKIFKGRVSDELTGLFAMLLEKSHIGEMKSVLEHFSDRCREYKHIGKATVTSAMELEGAQKTDIEKKLIATTGYESFEIDYLVDPSLIGGVVIRVGDRVCDGSLRSRLDRLTRELSETQI